MPGNNFSQNETNFDRQATVDDALRIHAERFGRENYDEFNSDASPRGRSVARSERHDFRKRRKSPCVQLDRQRRKTFDQEMDGSLDQGGTLDAGTQQIEINRQGFSFARNPSIPEMIFQRSLDSPVPSHSSMTGRSDLSIPSLFSSNISSSRESIDTSSSATSSSGIFIIPKEPSSLEGLSRSSSRNTFSDIHSEWSSTTALDQEIDGNIGQGGTLDQEMNSTEAYSSNSTNGLQFDAPQTQNQTGLKVSLSNFVISF